LIGYSLGAQFVRHTCHTADRSCVPLPAFLLLILGSPDLADQPAERFRDGLVTVLGRVYWRSQVLELSEYLARALESSRRNPFPSSMRF
jgi:hypothetical protein